MLDFDASKLLIIGVVALVVIGPKDLPRVLRQVGQAVTKIRRMAADFQGQFMDAMKEADLQDLQKEVSKLKDSATLEVNFDPVRDVRDELSGALEAKPAPPALDPVADASRAVADEARPETVLEIAAPAASDPEPGSPGPLPEAAPAPQAPRHSATAEADAAVFRTVADLSGGIGAPGAPSSARRRKIVVPKRRAPGDRLALSRRGTLVAAPSRLILPPRRDDPRA